MLAEIGMLRPDGQHHDRSAHWDDGDAVPFGPQHHAVRRPLRRVVDAIGVRPVVHGSADRRTKAALRLDDGHAEISGDDHRHGHPSNRTKST
jgi:hypothetical protein